MSTVSQRFFPVSLPLSPAEEAAEPLSDEHTTLVMRPKVRLLRPAKARREVALPSVIVAAEVFHALPARAPQPRVRRIATPRRRMSAIAVCIVALGLALIALTGLPLVGAAVDRTVGAPESPHATAP